MRKTTRAADLVYTPYERCVGKQEGRRVEEGIETPVVHGKRPVCPPPDARAGLEKDVTICCGISSSTKGTCGV